MTEEKPYWFERFNALLNERKELREKEKIGNQIITIAALLGIAIGMFTLFVLDATGEDAIAGIVLVAFGWFVIMIIRKNIFLREERKIADEMAQVAGSPDEEWLESFREVVKDGLDVMDERRQKSEG